MQLLDKNQTEKLKQIELELLKAFIASCDELKLNYYVVGGTLLGAVRHKGFIPWDDDIDVAMPRKDYEKWIKMAPHMLDNDKFFVQTYKTDPDYPANFAKLRNNNTTFIETSLRRRNINHGVYIDIFPLDYYPMHNRKLFKLNQLRYTSKIMKAYDLDAISYTFGKK